MMIKNNNIFRGIDLSKRYTLSQVNSNIKDNNFDDIFIGDYFVLDSRMAGKTGYPAYPAVEGHKYQYSKWRVASIGVTSKFYELNRFIILVSDVTFNAGGNEHDAPLFDRTQYYSFTATLIWNMLAKYLNPEEITMSYGTRITPTDLSEPELGGILSARMGSMAGYSSETSPTINRRSINPGLGLVQGPPYTMSEMNLYGKPILSSSYLDNAHFCYRFPLFRLRPEFINAQDGEPYTLSSFNFCKLREEDVYEYHFVTHTSDKGPSPYVFTNNVRPCCILG